MKPYSKQTIFHGICLGAACIAWGLMLSVASGAENASHQPPPAYQEALQNARQELASHNAKDGSVDGWSISSILSLIALAVATGMVIWLGRRWRNPSWSLSSNREMRILERMTIGRNTNLILVRVRETEYLLAEHPHGVTPVAEWPAKRQNPANQLSLPSQPDPAANRQ